MAFLPAIIVNLKVGSVLKTDDVAHGCAESGWFLFIEYPLQNQLFPVRFKGAHHVKVCGTPQVVGFVGSDDFSCQPLGFHWHPLEGAGHIFLPYFRSPQIPNNEYQRSEQKPKLGRSMKLEMTRFGFLALKKVSVLKWQNLISQTSQKPGTRWWFFHFFVDL